jgi:glycosyl-4,4'-diaponeurosporenoate acyltransferase
MLIELPVPATIALNVGGWAAIQLLCAWAFTRMPADRFGAPRPFAWERNGRIYDRLFHPRKWKHLLPEGAAWFAGGITKSGLLSRDPATRRAFMRETWRGELCHWCAMAWTPVFFLWNPWWADLIIVAYALGANMPCILVQRYNRARTHNLGHKSRLPN